MSGLALPELERRLPECLGRDRHRLRRDLRRLRRQRDRGRDINARLQQLGKRIDASCALRQLRRERLPQPQFPPELPIVARRDEICAAIREHQVVIICGETGSGKSTQLPKLCLHLGRGIDGLIGHTQPRRLAARTIAARVAEELGQSLGESVGFKVRFSDSVKAHSHIKVMTDGILLAETQSDRYLNAYDTLIIDEAHERSLNIDFLLGYLKTLLPRRPDLKLIITSATIDPQRFSRHFDDAPVIEVSGRTYPVEVRYQPLGSLDESEQDKDLLEGLLQACDSLSREGPGDILVFLPGEREIKEAADALRKHHPRNTEVVPLFARQGTAEQNRVFAPHSKRHIVLATNVAETSLTVPGIRYVVDTGLARISRYSPRTKVQRLPIEKISQASANQRQGRCGRVAEGICIRLYDEDDFNLRPQFTDAEIRRTSLASVILQLESLNFGQVEDFPFIDAPDSKYVSDGYKLLQELGAVDEQHRLTELGRRLARLPVDPRIARMLLAAQDEDCLSEILVIASALSIQDPRERPLDNPQAADEAHRRFADDKSDFLSTLKLWQFLQEQLQHRSRAQMRKLCRTNFLSHKRMREWLDIYSQLRGMVHDMGLRTRDQAASYEAVHRALLAGLLGNIGFLGERHEYTGARGIKFHIFPGSQLFKARPKWIMAAELAETSRTYARNVAAIEPMWVVHSAAHLLKTSWFEPHWEKKAGSVIAWEKVTLYGLVLIPKQKTDYARIDAADARRIFIEHALVQGELLHQPEFLRRNLARIEELRELEHRARRVNILIDEQQLFAFYDQRLPQSVCSLQHLQGWLKEADQQSREALLLSEADLLQADPDTVSDREFPKTLRLGNLSLPLSYYFSPGESADGVTLEVPLLALNQISEQRIEWLVPGLLAEKMTALIRSLPKSLRVNFVPAPNYAAACLAALTPDEEPLTRAMAEFLRRKTGVTIEASDWNLERLPPHLIMNIRVRDDAGVVVGESRNLQSLKLKLDQQVRESFTTSPQWPIEQDGLRDWSFGELPALVTEQQGGLELKGYPALLDEQHSVAIRVYDTADKARQIHHRGLRRLFMLVLPEQITYLRRKMPGIEDLCLQYAPVGKREVLVEDLSNAVVEQVFMQEFEQIRQEQQFRHICEQGRGQLISVASELISTVTTVMQGFNRLNKELKGKQPLNRLHAIADLREQINGLVYPGFITATPARWLTELPRYLQAMTVRLEKIERDPVRDKRLQLQLEKHWQRMLEQHSADKASYRETPEFETYRWMLEEFRVSLFAQELGTAVSVSTEKLQRQWQAVRQAGG